MNKKVLKNLLTMLQSSDKDNHYMAMQAIVNLGDPNTAHIDYEQEIIFLWLYGRPCIADWEEINYNIAAIIRNKIATFKKSKLDLKYKNKWLDHITRSKKPWIVELLIEEMIKENKRTFKALDFKFKDIQVNVIQ